MAQAEAGDVTAGCGSDTGDTVMHVAAADCSATGEADGCVTLPASIFASSRSCEYVTAGMSEVQIISAMIETSREQGWSELKDSPRRCRGTIFFSCPPSSTCNLGGVEEKGSLCLPRHPNAEVGAIDCRGQARINEATLPGDKWDLVAKVFKMEGFSLADLQRHWPLALLMPRSSPTTINTQSEYPWRVEREFVLGGVVFGEVMRACGSIHWGTILEDGQFAFVMPRYWGDLRALINLKLKDNHPGEPPFPHHQALSIIENIATGMRSLHERGVQHRDLKSLNVLFDVLGGDPRDDGSFFQCSVADYECAMLAEGTAFWRAAEVLKELLKLKASERDATVMWTEKGDVYSYAMTCYEVLTGHIPFFGYHKSDWKRVIDGERPHLPDYIPGRVRELVERCWHNDPSKRPTFQVIYDELNELNQ